LDAEGAAITLSGTCERRVSGCFAGAPQAALALARFPWKSIEDEPRRTTRVSLGFPRRDDAARVDRAQGTLLGLLAGDSLGAREALHAIEGQPVRAEPAIVLCRALAKL